MEFDILYKKQIYSGRAFDIELVRIKFPDGRERNYDLVNHPPAVTIIPIDQHQNILFVRQYRLGALSLLLELPAGVIEPGETPVQCAEREIREETGMAASQFTDIGNFYMAPGYSTELMHIFLATGLFSSPLRADTDEFLTVEKISKHNVIEYARSGHLIDGKSLSALFLVEPYL